MGVPVYNGERYIGETLDSLLAQTHEDIEIIVCDNASTDRTEEIVRDYAARDARVRYFRNERNLGLARNFNRVFELSDTPYFKWNMADDLSEPTLIERCLETLEACPEAVLAYAKARLIDESGVPFRDHDDDLDLRSPDPVWRFSEAQRRLGLCNVFYGVLRSDLVRQTRLIGSHMAADLVFVPELSLYGWFCEVPERLFLRRFHGSASSAMTTDDENYGYWNTAATGAPLGLCRYLLGCSGAILHTPLPLRTKLSLLRIVGRNARWRRGEIWRELRQALGRKRVS